MIKVLVIGDVAYARPFLSPDHDVTTVHHRYAKRLIEEGPEVGLVVFTGGEDVTPSYYGEDEHHTTYNNRERDIFELHVFELARKLGIPMAGICRGSQFLNVMVGGSLVQNVHNHAVGHGHRIRTTRHKEFDRIQVTSTHHQMMIPTEKGELLAYAEGLSPVYEGGRGNINPGFKRNEQLELMEPEVVWYEEERCLCTQYHPEYMPNDSEGYSFYQKLLKETVYA